MAQPKNRSKKFLWISLAVFCGLSLLCLFVILWNETGIFGNDSIYKPLSDCRVPPAKVAEDAHWSEVVPDSSWEKMDANNLLGISAVAVDSEDRIYVAGDFSQVGSRRAEGIARWDPQARTWNNLGDGLLPASDSIFINRLEIDDLDRVYVAGNFNLAGNQIANGIAKWDGQTWHALASGLMNGQVNDFALAGDGKLYAAGTFLQVGAQKVNGIAFWDGQAWQDPGGMSQKLVDLLGGVPEEVSAIAYDQAHKFLYASGTFDREQTRRGFMAVWKEDSQSWGLMAEAPYFSPPTRLKMTPWGALIAGGSTNFKVDAFGSLSYWGTSFPAASYGIAIYENTKWSGLKSGLTLMGGSKKYLADHGDSPVDPVYATEMVFDRSGQLFIVGRFISVDDKCMYGIARWDGRDWSALGSGLAPANFFGPARSLAFDSQGNLYVGGNFQTAGGEPIRYLARWAP
jgi:hypothetical protein